MQVIMPDLPAIFVSRPQHRVREDHDPERHPPRRVPVGLDGDFGDETAQLLEHMLREWRRT